MVPILLQAGIVILVVPILTQAGICTLLIIVVCGFPIVTGMFIYFFSIVFSQAGIQYLLLWPHIVISRFTYYCGSVFLEALSFIIVIPILLQADIFITVLWFPYCYRQVYLLLWFRYGSMKVIYKIPVWIVPVSPGIEPGYSVFPSHK